MNVHYPRNLTRLMFSVRFIFLRKKNISNFDTFVNSKLSFSVINFYDISRLDISKFSFILFLIIENLIDSTK